MLSRSVEDYLKTIYSLGERGEDATTGRIAERLDVAPASVTGMVKRLGGLEPPLVEREPRAGVHLTREGRRAALHTVRRHRLLELFLLEVLHYEWDEIHAEAERLEHAVSPMFVERISLLLGEPSFDPHGDPIPDAELNVPALHLRRLSELSAGATVTARRITDDRPQLLRYLASVGLRPGAAVQVRESNALSNTIEVTVAGKPVTVGLSVGEVIFTEAT